MLIAFSLREGRLQQFNITNQGELPRDALWIDIIDPNSDERRWVQDIYQQLLPVRDELLEIEASARYYEDENGLHLHSYFLQDHPGLSHNTTVSFTVHNGRLFTFHYEDVGAFRAFRTRLRRQGYEWDALAILLELFDTKVERLADLLEHLYAELETVSQEVLIREENDMQKILSVLAKHEDLNGKIRLSLMDKQRVLAFLLRSRALNPTHTQHLREILRDIQSLLAHSAFLFEKVDFLMEAARGFINIEQNQIIKIFSIAAVVFLPPTLIASIYGMNFNLMPELNWSLGYPFAISLMIASGVAPYWYFKRKGWL